MADERGFTPPYGLGWATFLNTIERMETQGIPDRVDRSFLSTQSGNTQTYIIAALRELGLIDDTNVATDDLLALVEQPGNRKALVAKLLQRFYPRVLELGKSNSTAGQLQEVFREEYGQEGNTRRKAITFFMHAATYAELPLSKLWSTGTRPPTAKPGASRPRKQTRKTTARVVPAPQATTTDNGDAATVELRSGGQVRLHVSVNLFDLTRNDRTFVLGLIDAMKDYGQGDPQTAGQAGGPENT